MNLRQPVTIVTIAINVLVFAVLAWHLQSLMMNKGSDVIAILQAGANLNPFTLGGQPWRIITSMFLHFGIIHVVVNMYALWNLGTLLEPGIGSLRFTLLYVITGLSSGIASLIFNEYVISAGASGAIFGLYGYVLGAELIGSYRDRAKLQQVLINFLIFVGVNAFLTGVFSVDLAGHIGGCVAGLVFSFFHFKLGLLKGALQMALVLIILPAILFFLPKDQLAYYNLFQRIIKQDRFSSDILREVKSNNALADSLRKSESEWRSIQRDLRSMPRIPASVTEDTTSITRYISLRTREVRYRLHILDESYIYMDSIEVLHAQFDSVPPIRHVLNFNPPPDEPVTKDSSVNEIGRQDLTTLQVYYDENWREINDSEAAAYYRIGTRDSLNRWQGSVRDFYRNGDLQMKGGYKDDLRDGVFIYYSDHSTHTSAGRYDLEYPIGKWEHFHWNGSKESEIFHTPEFFTKSVWDSLGNPLVSQGSGEYKRWHANGILAEQGNFVNGRRDGYWLGFHDDGSQYYKEYYQNNRLINGLSEGKDGRRYAYDGFSEIPVPLMGVKEYKKYLDKNKRYPPGETKHGQVKVLFNVGIDGSLWDFVILKSVSPVLDQEAIRLIREGPGWRPASAHGEKKIQSQGLMEVEF
ncbi:MAG TPA: rhomboid family intramembrane serine protease [Ohtaekwangia sp.]